MRKPRIKAPEGQTGLYHCHSRIVGGEFIFGDYEKEFFVRQMWKLARFTGVEVLDYTVMSNHYHQFVEVPGRILLDDAQLLERVGDYYGNDSSHRLGLEQAMKKKGKVARRARRRYLRMMGDISVFQKILKQRFATWYNKQHNRKGTLWMGRFNANLVENSLQMRKIISAYIDLNAVRAEMVNDPKDYRFCGYAAALAGDLRCRKGIQKIMGISDWKEAAAAYRAAVIFQGSQKVKGKRGVISRETLLETLDRKGYLPARELFGLRIRYITEGLVLGSQAFVEEVFQRYRPYFGKRRQAGALPLKNAAWPGIHTIQNLRQAVFV